MSASIKCIGCESRAVHGSITCQPCGEKVRLAHEERVRQDRKVKGAAVFYGVTIKEAAAALNEQAGVRS